MKYIIVLFFFSHFALLNLKAKEVASKIEMKHMPDGAHCFLCHLNRDYKKLVLRNGTPIALDKVDTVCGQCHGMKYRRWLDGRHGKLAGSWIPSLGKRESCVACHNPHAPKLKKIMATSPPRLRQGL